MSWQIPTQIEQDIIAGKAKYQTFQTGNGGQSILAVPPNSYAVIFGYDFSPAGGGNSVMGDELLTGANALGLIPTRLRPFETQQISFYTGTDFFPFIHHVNVEASAVPYIVDATNPLETTTKSVKILYSIDNTPLSRQVYITSTNDVTITVGLILRALRNTAAAIPITNRTPQGLTYGGSPQLPNVQTDYGPVLTPQQFMQPSTKDFADFAFGLLPGNADNQAFATPDATSGLIDPSEFSAAFTTIDLAGPAYYLCLHYAIYSKTIPEQRG